MCPPQAPTCGSARGARSLPKVSSDHWLSASVNTRMSLRASSTAAFSAPALPTRGRSRTTIRESRTLNAVATVSSLEPSLARMICRSLAG